jgi:hypothetical protein
MFVPRAVGETTEHALRLRRAFYRDDVYECKKQSNPQSHTLFDQLQVICGDDDCKNPVECCNSCIQPFCTILRGQQLSGLDWHQICLVSNDPNIKKAQFQSFQSWLKSSNYYNPEHHTDKRIAFFLAALDWQWSEYECTENRFCGDSQGISLMNLGTRDNPSYYHAESWVRGKPVLLRSLRDSIVKYPRCGFIRCVNPSCFTLLQ